jgi:hypothetical protein
MNTAVMIFLLPVALAAVLWWLDRAKEKRAAEQAAAIRRTYTNHTASSPWIRPKSGDLAFDPSNAEDYEDDAVLELSASGGFRAQNKTKGSRWMPR